MMKQSIFLTLIMTVGLCFGQSWSLDANHSRLQFTVKHLSITDVEGSVKDFSVILKLDEKNIPATKIEVYGNVNSLDTGNSARDNHIKGEDFFDAAKFPAIKFVSSSVTKKEDYYILKGDLSMHGMKKPVSLRMYVSGPVLNPRSNKKTIGLVVVGAINRKDFGIGEDSSEMMIGNQVTVEANLQFVQE